MALDGTALLAIWNTIAPELDASEYDAWLTREHLRERADIPGFLRARRYCAATVAAPAYFNCYELADAAVLNGADYQARVAEPSTWTRAMKPHLRTAARGCFSTLASLGDGLGGALATIRFSAEKELAPHRAAKLGEALMRDHRLVGAHVAVERNGAANRTEPVSHLVLLEGARPGTFDACASLVRREIAHAVDGASHFNTATFVLSCVVAARVPA